VVYDEDLADRIRALVATERGLSEKKMFGGIAFLVGGNMAIAASGQGGILVRVDPERSDALVATTKASVAVMRGGPMAGWLRVAADRLRPLPAGEAVVRTRAMPRPREMEPCAAAPHRRASVTSATHVATAGLRRGGRNKV
jgi:hypothetical protein